MPLSADPVSRIRKHTRSARFEAYARSYAREHGLRDLEVHLTDVKPDEHPHGAGVRPHYPRRHREARTGGD